jgi:hypothetical protein
MRFKSAKSMSAAELMAQLQRDPEFVRKNGERETQQRAVEAQLRAEEQPLLAELANAGVHVASVWDLVNSRSSYAAAIPVLTRHLRLPYHPKIREGLARALTVREARGVAGRAILDELKRPDESSHELRWVLANALAEAGDVEMADEIETLVGDARHKDVCEILKLALKNLRHIARQQ